MPRVRTSHDWERCNSTSDLAGWKAASGPAQLAGLTDLSVPGSYLGQVNPLSPPRTSPVGTRVALGLVAGGLCLALGGLGDPPWGAGAPCVPSSVSWGPVHHLMATPGPLPAVVPSFHRRGEALGSDS